MPPKAFIQSSVIKEGAQVPHGPCRISIGTVFQHIIETVMEYDSIVNLTHGFADDAGLAQRYPVSETAFYD